MTKLQGIILNGPIKAGEFNYCTSEDCFGSRLIATLEIKSKYINSVLQLIIEDFGFFRLKKEAECFSAAIQKCLESK